MPCYSPLRGWRSRSRGANGRRPIVFKASEGYPDLPVKVPCGQCIGCRLERSRQWAIRCVHEASEYDDNCFITLTYDNDHLPDLNSLNVRDWQLFMKRFRKKYSYRRFKFFHCGEYGDLNKRPHYHAIIFGVDFEDRRFFKENNGVPLYTSETLEKLWPFGYSTVGDVTFESAAYVARYCLKKITGDAADAHYRVEKVDQDGVVTVVGYRKPEYTTQSNGIGRRWLDKYGRVVRRDDSVVLRGREMRPPRFYDKVFEHDAPEEFEKTRRRRARSARVHQADSTPERLAVREKVQHRRLPLLPRALGKKSEGD